jgi:hypothetical protein
MLRSCSLFALSAVTTTALLCSPASGQLWMFDVQPQFVEAIFPWDVDLADLDGDGSLDMIVSQPEFAAGVKVFLNDGAGGFGTGTSYDIGDWADATAVGDLDGDGDPDLAMNTRQSTQTLTTLLNDGAGAFTLGAVVPVTTWTEDIALGDLDGDGDLDAILPTWGSSNVMVMSGDGAGGFGGEVLVPLTGDNCFAAVIEDLDADGDLDSAVACFGGVPTNSGRLHVFDNPGDGSFGGLTTYPVHKGTWSLEAGDMDGDGDPDLVTTNRNVNSVSVFLNDGAGAFAPQMTTTVGNFPKDGTLGDFDADGDLDVAVPSASGFLMSLLRNDGTGSLSLLNNFFTSHAHTCAGVGDLDGDGILDIVAGGGPADLDLYEGEGPWAFLGAAMAGVNGDPVLEGEGSLQPDTTATLTQSNGKPLAPAILVLGYSSTGGITLKGGTLVPFPDELFFLPLDASGGFELLGHWPPGVPSATSFYVQTWIEDDAGPKNWAASNALVAQTP